MSATAALLMFTVATTVGGAEMDFAAPSEQESVQTLLLGRGCITFGAGLPYSIITFAPAPHAQAAMDDIALAAGIHRNGIILREGLIPDAIAITCGEHRYILYDRGFIDSAQRASDNFWAIRSIFAHELGHHLNGHTLSQDPDRFQRELEADFFSGLLLQRMGADDQQARATLSLLGMEEGSDNHPPLDLRLQAISAGWLQACSAAPSCSAQVNAAVEKPDTQNARGSVGTKAP